MSVLIFSAETREPISEPRHARQVIASLPVNLYMIFIGVGRFRILGGQGLEYWGGQGLEYWGVGGGARFRILGGPRFRILGGGKV